MFCVECGKEAGDALVAGVCHPCFLEKNEFTRLPEHVDLEVCVHCNARKRGEIWLTGSASVEPLIEEAIREAAVVDRRVAGLSMRAELVAEDEKNFTCTATFSGAAEGVAFEEVRTTRSRVKGGTCLRCSRIQGGYFEGVVQVRASHRDLSREEVRGVRLIASRLIDRIVADGDKNAFVLKDMEIEGGIDIYAGTNNAGRMIAKAVSEKFGGKLKEHAKIAGKKDGNDLYRITFAVRIPEFQNGDVVVYKDEPLLVQSIGAKNVTLRSPITARVQTVAREEVEDLHVIKREAARPAVVVSATETELQLLDPWNYSTVTVLRPAGLDALGESVDVVKWEGELVPLPPAATPGEGA